MLFNSPPPLIPSTTIWSNLHCYSWCQLNRNGWPGPQQLRLALYPPVPTTTFLKDQEAVQLHLTHCSTFFYFQWSQARQGSATWSLQQCGVKDITCHITWTISDLSVWTKRYTPKISSAQMYMDQVRLTCNCRLKIKRDLFSLFKQK